MNYETFKEYVVRAVKKQEGTQTQVSIHPVIKNNGLHLDGLVIQADSVNISPTIYLNEYYDNYRKGTPLETIYTDILAQYHSNQLASKLDLSFFTDYDKVKSNIVFKLISYEENRELLDDVPYFRYLDLAIVFNCLLQNTLEGNGTILIHNHHLNLWYITPDMLYELAKENTPRLLPPDIHDMDEIVQSLITVANMDIKPDTRPFSMYVLTNQIKLHGASCILYDNILTDFSEKLNCSLYIIPSSIHEVLLLPALEHFDVTELNDLIKEVNTTQVSNDEVLSNHAYFFSKDTHMLSM